MPADIASLATSVAVNLLIATRWASRAFLVAIFLSDDRASAIAFASIRKSPLPQMIEQVFELLRAYGMGTTVRGVP